MEVMTPRCLVGSLTPTYSQWQPAGLTSCTHALHTHHTHFHSGIQQVWYSTRLTHQVWPTSCLTWELPGYRGQHGWSGGWTACWHAGNLHLERLTLTNLSRWWWWWMEVQAIQEQQLYFPLWKSSALKNGGCHPCIGETAFKRRKIQIRVIEILAFKFPTKNCPWMWWDTKWLKDSPIRNVIHPIKLSSCDFWSLHGLILLIILINCLHCLNQQSTWLPCALCVQCPCIPQFSTQSNNVI